MSLLDRAIVSVLPAVPRRIVRRLSSPYIAGTDLAAARATVAGLNAAGKLATVDVLGEVIGSADEARAITETYLEVLDAIELDRFYQNLERWAARFPDAMKPAKAELLSEEVNIHRSQGTKATVTLGLVFGRRKEPGEKPPLSRDTG